MVFRWDPKSTGGTEEDEGADITDLIGRVGSWHYILLGVIFINSLFNAYGQLAMAFMMPPNVEFHCARTEEAIKKNISTEEWLKMTHNDSIKVGYRI